MATRSTRRIEVNPFETPPAVGLPRHVAFILFCMSLLVQLFYIWLLKVLISLETECENGSRSWYKGQR